MKIKHSIYIITYNQEGVIGRALDSIIGQKEYVHEIVISDDCSKDGTWKVVQKYKVKYPNLIKAFRNEKNLGIFGNIEISWTRVTGNVIFPLSGDDILCNGLFEEANKLISKNELDVDNDFFTLYFDWKSINPNGIEKIGSNSLVLKHNPFSLKLRNLIQNRTTGFSRKVLDRFTPIRKDIGIYADILIDIQTMYYAKIHLYSPFVGSVYYKGGGIASSTPYFEKMKSISLVFEELQKNLVGLSKKDKNWVQYRRYKSQYIVEPKISLFFRYLWSLVKIIDFEYGFDFILKEIKTFFWINYKLLKNRMKKK